MAFQEGILWTTSFSLILWTTSFSYQLRVALNRGLYPLRLNTDIPLRHGGGAVLQKPLDQGDVIAIRLVNLGGVALAEAVGADPLIAQVITGDGKLLLVCPPQN